MSDSIYKSNYIECLKVTQRTYIVSFASALGMLSLSLTSGVAKVGEILSIPIIGVGVQRFPAAIFTFLILVASGIALNYFYTQLLKIEKNLSKTDYAALKTYPAFGNAPFYLEVITLFLLISVVTFSFWYTSVEKSFFDSVGAACTVLLGHVFALFRNAWNKWLMRAQECVA